MAEPVSAVVARTFREEQGRALATVARLTGDLQLAEDAVQEALVAALRTWPTSGVPSNPGAWLTTTARNRALDVVRREAARPRRESEAIRGALEGSPPVLHPVADDELRLVLACCHPALARSARVPLTLRLACGLTTAEIARVLLEGEAAVAKRIQRAKAKIRDARIPLTVPPPDRLAERLPSVLEVLYLVFTEGHSSTSGALALRDELCDEAIRLGRLVAELAPGPGPSALLALMLLHDSRRAARLYADGRLVLLADQDRSRWDRARIAEGLEHLERAAAAPAVERAAASYLLQAAIAAEHVRAPSWGTTDWPAVVAGYDELLALTASPVVALNRAIAVSFADGPAVARPLLDALVDEPRLQRSVALWLARADVARRLGAVADAEDAYRRALALDLNDAQRAHVEDQLGSLLGPSR